VAVAWWRYGRWIWLDRMTVDGSHFTSDPVTILLTICMVTYLLTNSRM
jgi:hypothetical protein